MSIAQKEMHETIRHEQKNVENYDSEENTFADDDGLEFCVSPENRTVENKDIATEHMNLSSVTSKEFHNLRKNDDKFYEVTDELRPPIEATTMENQPTMQETSSATEVNPCERELGTGEKGRVISNDINICKEKHVAEKKEALFIEFPSCEKEDLCQKENSCLSYFS